jgi:hypothetical protein
MNKPPPFPNSYLTPFLLNLTHTTYCEIPRNLSRPFRFDFQSLLKRARQKANTQVDGISINLPFLTLSVRPDDLEREMAREVVIRLADLRVLNSFECCDDCIEKAIESLQDIRWKLVEKQVAMAKMTDSPIYLLVPSCLDDDRRRETLKLCVSNAVVIRCNMETHAFGFTLRANAPEGQRRFLLVNSKGVTYANGEIRCLRRTP